MILNALEVILYIEDVDLNCRYNETFAKDSQVILYIEDVDLNTAISSHFSMCMYVILYIEDVDLNFQFLHSYLTQMCHPLH